MQTPRDISYTGNPTGGTTAYPAVLPAAHEATENSDNIFYRTIRTVMKKQLIYLLASAGLLAAGCSTENDTEATGYGTLSVSCTADTRITWRGYDIDQQYEVQKDMVIDIEADKGIKSFFVTIDSETLRPLLPEINLPEKFDICDIPDELVEVLHGEFGFPINEQEKNRTSGPSRSPNSSRYCWKSRASIISSST